MTATLATLIVYAYTSFTASWGPGPAIIKKFEGQCHCQVTLVNGGDAGALLGRLKLEGEKSPVDVVIGIDESMIPKYKSELEWKSASFTKFDEAPYAFVYNTKHVQKAPDSLDALLNPEWKNKIVIEDPRLSTTGLGFLLWVVSEKGDGAWDYFKKLKPQIKMISPSWDLAYGLFKKGHADLVFSYWTSPAYHVQEEQNFDYKAAVFKNGHYVQREYATVAPASGHQKLAKEFVRFLLSVDAQEVLPRKNFMFPANPKAKLSPAFQKLGRPKELPPLKSEQLDRLEEWLKRWREIYS